MKKLFLLLIPLLLFGCTRSSNFYTTNMFYMDTYINVKIYDVSKEESEKAFKDVDNLYKEYHELTDRYDKFNNVKNIYYLNNELKPNTEVKIDNKLYTLIQLGIDDYKMTNGLVNIAIGNVVDVWKKYRDKGTGVPTVTELKNSGSININDIVLTNGTFMKTSDVRMDLGAIAKGYVTELAGRELEKLGYTKYIINAGGNVKVGDHYSNSKYKVGIQDPINSSDVFKIVKANDMSIVTSGNYQRYYDYNGVRYNHIIDPNTLFPSQYVDSVTVITKDSSYADAMSTYLFILPIDEGINLVNSLSNVEAVWYGIDNKIYYSKGFNKYE